MGKNRAGTVLLFLNTVARKGLTEQLTFEQHFRKYVDYRRKNVPGQGRACAEALRWAPVPYVPC